MKKILIIDDEELVVKAMTDYLIDEGYEIGNASDGGKGLKMVKEFKPDLILLDIIMPIMDGLTVLKKLKEDDSTKEIPVIILTNLETDESIEEAVKFGGRDYLVKVNYSLKELSERIKEVLSNHQGADI